MSDLVFSLFPVSACATPRSRRRGSASCADQTCYGAETFATSTLRGGAIRRNHWRSAVPDVTILNRDGIELLWRIDDAKGTAIYCDPPYLMKGAKYVHDFDTTNSAGGGCG